MSDRKLMAQERATTDMAKRKQIFKELAQATLNEGSIIYYDYPKVVMGYRTSVTGIAAAGSRPGRRIVAAEGDPRHRPDVAVPAGGMRVRAAVPSRGRRLPGRDARA